MRNKALFFSIFLVFTVLASCKKEDKGLSEAVKPVRVKTMAVAATNIYGSSAYSGTVEESSGVSLSFPVSGTVKYVAVQPGQRVAKGQLVATLDAATLKNAYDIAKATLDQAQDAYDRLKQLHDANSLPDMQWVEIQNTLRQAQNSEQIAARAMNDANLYAPTSGYVSEKFIEPGMTVAPIEPVVKIVNINPVKVNVSVPESDISKIAVGRYASVNVPSADNASFQGVITEKGVAANPITRAYDVKIKIDNPASVLLPGMICDVAFEGDSVRQEIILPVNAVLLDADNTNFVWKATAGKAVKQIVGVTGITDRGITINSGIAAGDSVIVEGQQKVSQGTQITVIN